MDTLRGRPLGGGVREVEGEMKEKKLTEAIAGVKYCRLAPEGSLIAQARFEGAAESDKDAARLVLVKGGVWGVEWRVKTPTRSNTRNRLMLGQRQNKNETSVTSVCTPRKSDKLRPLLVNGASLHRSGSPLGMPLILFGYVSLVERIRTARVQV